MRTQKVADTEEESGEIDLEFPFDKMPAQYGPVLRYPALEIGDNARGMR